MCQFLSTLLVWSLPTQQISSFFSLSFSHSVAVTSFPQQRPVFPHQSGILNKFTSLTFNPYHYFHSLFSSFPPSRLNTPSSLWVSYIYFSKVFLIWRAARPGRFSPWLQLLSQLLSPAGAALCWALSSIWSSVSVWVCDIRVYMSIAHGFFFRPGADWQVVI